MGVANHADCPMSFDFKPRVLQSTKASISVRGKNLFHTILNFWTNDINEMHLIRQVGRSTSNNASAGLFGTKLSMCVLFTIKNVWCMESKSHSGKSSSILSILCANRENIQTAAGTQRMHQHIYSTTNIYEMD